MKKLLRLVVYIFVICAASVAHFAMKPAQALQAGKYFALHEATAVYAEQNFDSAILERLDKDTQIQVLDTQTKDNIEWCEVVSGGRAGYIAADNLYIKESPQSYTLRNAKITADGGEIFLYESPRADATKLVRLYDGVRVLLTGAASGDYLEVVHNGQRGYVAASAVTSGITYYQTLALIVGIVSVVAVAAVVLLSRIAKNNRKKQ